MHPALDATAGARYHSLETRVASRALVNEIRTELLSFSSRDRRIQQLRKDIQQGRNKCAETLAAIVTDPTADRPINDRGRIGKRITDFFSAHAPRSRRTICQLNPIETKEEGDINNVQMAIAQGDHSTQALDHLIEEIDQYVPVLLEMRAAAVAERYRTETRS